MKVSSRLVGIALTVAVSLSAQAPQNYLNNNTFTNFESPHVHPLDLTPDGTKLLAVNTANAALEVFDASNPSKIPTLLRSIPVGVDPVSVRARTNTEAWVVNVISDSVSVVDLTNGVVTKTLQADDEPADVIFAGTSNSLALVSCAQAKTLLVFNATAPTTPTARIPINGEQPRSLAISPNGRYVYLAIFESGNGTTILPGGVANGEEPSIVDDPRGPYAGANPPPNSGTTFSPAINSALPTPPPVSLIVKRTATSSAVTWMDDNNHDWSPFLTGKFAANGTANAHAAGWDLPDRDVAIIDTQSNFAVTYQTGLMNILMSMAVNPATGQVTVIGTDATNQVRFQSNLQSTFVRVRYAAFTPGGSNTILDLNPHLNYASRSIPIAQRLLSVGDPRGIAWNAAGTTAYITGMGSNNVITINQAGARTGLITVGQGPTGIVLQESNSRAFVLNKFDATISTISLATSSELGRTSLLYDPTPAGIKAGRPILYNTQTGSGLGQAACGSCHVDARWDRLAWDLGDPTGSLVTNAQGVTYHPMKGPLLTQTLIDVVQAPDLHWRGDRPVLEDFEGAFHDLDGADTPATDDQIANLRRFLSTLTLPPDPYRNLDDSFSTSVAMPGPNNTVYTTGNAVLGAQEFESSCRSTCHVGQTGRGSFFDADATAFGAGVRQPPTWKNFYKRIGLWYTDPIASNSGFGTQQDGTFDSSQNQTRDPNLYAFMMSFNGGFPYEPSGLNATNWSNFAHAAVGKQVTLTAANPTDTTGLLAQLETLAASGTIGLIAKGAAPPNATRGYMYLGNGQWQSDHLAEIDSTTLLMSAVTQGWDITFTAVPVEGAVRMGIDMDGDGILDFDDAQPAIPNANISNLALTGTATAVSQWDSLHTPAQAIDGNTNGYFDQNALFHSAGGTNDWWQVDLGQQSNISLIQLFNRIDCCSTRLSNVYVFVSQTPFTSGDLNTTIAQSGVQQFFLTGYAGLTPQLPMNVQGRYVRVQLSDAAAPVPLQLAEVRVMGYPVAAFTSPGTQTTTVNTSVSLPLAFSNPAANTYTFTAAGLPTGLAINPSTGVISGAPAATAAATNTVTVTATGPGNPTTTFTWNVTPLAQTIAFAAIPAQNVGGTLLVSATASSGLPITFTIVQNGSCSISGATVTFLATGNCGVIANQAGGSGYAAATAVGQVITVNPAAALKSQTITFPTIPTQTVGAPLTLSATASSALAVTFTSSTTTICTVSGTTATFLAAGTCSLTAAQPGNSTYAAATSVAQSFTVAAAPVSTGTIVNLAPYYTITAINTAGTAPTKGGADSWSGIAYNSATLGTSATYAGIAFPFGPTNAPDAFYWGPVALPAGTFTNLYVLATGVDQAWPTQTITITYTDGSTSAFTQSFSNWNSPASYSGETIVATATNSLKSGSIVASPAYVYGYTFPLTAGKTAASVAFPQNSNIIVFAIGLKAGAAPALQSQTITFPTIAAQITGTTLPLTATATSGLAVTYTSSTTTICTVSGTTATFLAAGTCTLTAAQPGNGTYAAATPVAQSFPVTTAPLKPQTITFPTIASQTAATTLTLTASATSTLPITYTSATTGVCSVNGATATLLAAGTCSLTATQPGNATYAAATPVSQSFAVAAASTSGTIVNLAPYYNIDAIGTSGTAAIAGGADRWAGVAYNSATLGTAATYAGIVFPFGPPNAPDAFFWGPVALPAGTFANLYVLGTGTDAPWTNQLITITFTDGSTTTYTQSLSNWTAPAKYTGETTVLTATNSLQNGTVVNTPVSVYGYTFAIPAGKVAASINFPQNSSVLILGIALK